MWRFDEIMFRACCEKSDYKMSATQSVILRVAIVFGMMVGVVAVLYFTPLPEQIVKSCDRPCHDLDMPMICRLTIHVETPEHVKHCRDCADLANSRDLLALNGRTPGGPIQVCHNDILVVDVVNKMAGQSLTLHWRGQPNRHFPFMDGVPLVTQCPVLSYTTFQYRFRATAPGTHLYHAYSDQELAKGVFGALVVRQADGLDPHRDHYDVDSKSHVILISEAADDTMLINGKTAPLPASFNVVKNRRHRFRVVYTGNRLACPSTLSVDGHAISVIALDGNPTVPVEVVSVSFSKGERVDFVLKTKRDVDSYFLRVKSCSGDALAVVNYEGVAREDKESKGESELQGRRLTTGICEGELAEVCLGDVRSLVDVPERLRNDDVKVVYLAFGSRIVQFDGEFSSKIYSVNNLTFTYPSSPLLTQLDQVSLSSVCDELNVPERCRGRPMCECVHVEYIPLGTSTEIVLVNQDGDDREHIFHLHGHSFYVVGSRQLHDVPRAEDVKLLDQQGTLFKRNFDRPVLKDTVRVPKNGVVALRFVASNPGFWMLRDEKSKGLTRGMDVVFQVGVLGDMVSPPKDFPTCGNFIGPQFFLRL